MCNVYTSSRVDRDEIAHDRTIFQTIGTSRDGPEEGKRLRYEVERTICLRASFNRSTAGQNTWHSNAEKPGFALLEIVLVLSSVYAVLTKQDRDFWNETSLVSCWAWGWTYLICIKNQRPRGKTDHGKHSLSIHVNEDQTENKRAYSITAILIKIYIKTFI